MYCTHSPHQISCLCPQKLLGLSPFFFFGSAVSQGTSCGGSWQQSLAARAGNSLAPWQLASSPKSSVLGTMTEQFLGQKLWLHFFLESLCASLEWSNIQNICWLCWLSYSSLEHLLCKISPYSVLVDSNVISLATASPNIFLSEFLGMSQEGGPPWQRSLIFRKQMGLRPSFWLICDIIELIQCGTLENSSHGATWSSRRKSFVGSFTRWAISRDLVWLVSLFPGEHLCMGKTHVCCSFVSSQRH